MKNSCHILINFFTLSQQQEYECFSSAFYYGDGVKLIQIFSYLIYKSMGKKNMLFRIFYATKILKASYLVKNILKKVKHKLKKILQIFMHTTQVQI